MITSWLIFLAAAAFLTALLLRVIDALYFAHPDLLLRQPHTLCAATRHAFLYCIIVSTGAALLAAHFPPLNFTLNWFLTLFLAVIILTDYEQRLIFNRVLLGLALLSLLGSPWIAASLPDRVAAALLGGGLMLALAILSRGGLGGGDIKLLFVLGFWQGLDALFFILLFGFLSGGVAAALLLLSGRKKRRDFFAYGPYFALGALLSLFH